MLLRAFGPPSAPPPRPVDAAACLALARRFELSARVAARNGRERLAAELGAETADGFRRDQSMTAALGLRLLAVARDVAEAAVPLDLPLVVFLKYVALDAVGLPVVGARSACDVDVLVPAGREGDLQRALLARGYHDSGLREGEHQLPSLTHPGGGKVEVHRRMPGVRPASSRSATLEALAGAGLLSAVPGLPGRCAVPVPGVLAAHALVHGLGQHGFWPDSYPLFKMVGDLADLGFADPGKLEEIAPWVARDVSREEAEAVRRLCGALVAGSDPAGWPGEEGEEVGGEMVLLRHILAGRLDPDYAAAMRLGFFHSQPSDHPPLVRLLRSVVDALVLSRAQIDAIYGPPRHPLGYLGRRLARPLDLLRRLGSYGIKALRVRP